MRLNPNAAFLRDMQGMYEQHAAMWVVYTDGIKILVTINSIPLLIASGFLALRKQDLPIEWSALEKMPTVLGWVMILTPVLCFCILGLVIHYRLVILFYARCLNDYRRIYLEDWNARRESAHLPKLELCMPINKEYPANYELGGPMGLIVHGSALVSASYLTLAVISFGASWCCALFNVLLVFAAFEFWYWWQARKRPHLP